MGHNDHLDDHREELPPEAGVYTQTGFEPNDNWLKSASPETCHEAMRQWFLSRYCDPAYETPYNGREGGYLYLHGGPYNAEEQLYGRFSGLFTDEIIQAVAQDVESDGIVDWAPIHTEPDYDDEFQYDVNNRDDSYRFFKQRLTEIDSLRATGVQHQHQSLLNQLLYSSLIAALETYLSDTMSYWVAVEKKVLRDFVSNCQEFKQQKLTLSQIFERLDALDDHVEEYLQQVVWHRLDKVVPLMTDSFGIARPSIEQLMQHILVRHDIVHRGGKRKDGSVVIIDINKLDELYQDVNHFVKEFESSLNERFPNNTIDFDEF